MMSRTKWVTTTYSSVMLSIEKGGILLQISAKAIGLEEIFQIFHILMKSNNYGKEFMGNLEFCTRAS